MQRSVLKIKSTGDSLMESRTNQKVHRLIKPIDSYLHAYAVYIEYDHVIWINYGETNKEKLSKDLCKIKKGPLHYITFTL